MSTHYAGQLTVGALKKLLDIIPDEYVVYTEGCDCIGPADGMSLYDKKAICIHRNDNLTQNIHEPD